MGSPLHLIVCFKDAGDIFVQFVYFSSIQFIFFQKSMFGDIASRYRTSH
jgi:hypothetical protein